MKCYANERNTCNLIIYEINYAITNLQSYSHSLLKYLSYVVY